VRHEPKRKPPAALDPETLERLALFYVGRYATTRAKLRAYLKRKLTERGWAGARAPDTEALVGRFAELGYVDDRAFAASRASSLQRRGYGERRIGQALHAAGIERDDAENILEEARDGGWEAALRYAERKRIGPYAEREPDREAREKAFAAMIRAGHSFDTARKLLSAAPGDVPEQDDF
jgi:regulatory protein